MCNNKDLARSIFNKIWLVGCLGLVALDPGCRASPSQRESAEIQGPVARGPALPLDRIAIVGASVSAGFGGMPLGDAFTAAAKRSHVDSAASTLLFRDPLGDTKRQLAQAIAFKPTVVVGLDLLFWHVYGARAQGLESALGELEQVRTSGAWIVLGDVPLITTASEFMLPKESIPDPATLAAANETIGAWSARERVLLVPLVEWTEPLRAEADVEIAPGERVAARSLMALDGLHANPLGTWYLLDKLDRYIQDKLPGTAKDALVFARPPRE